MPEEPRPKKSRLAAYLRESRDLGTGFLFVLPLLLAYELGVVWTRSDVVNGASALLRATLHALAPAGYGLAAFNAAVVIAVFAAVVHTWEREKPVWRPGLYLAMGLESAVDALALLLLLVNVPRVPMAAGAGPPEDGLLLGIVLSLGAGVYEEIFFRLLLLGGVLWGLKRIFGLSERPATTIALVFSALLFSLFHHLGPLGEPLRPQVLAIRTVAGLFLGTLYLSRGLGIAVGAHALYDVAVTLVHAARAGPA
ncbi:MAG: CPBP family intramembrane metalloprotease [Planctomycetales bacterium]|nr:CPBP family intramembrane metalloprotease [Planctomycetales bacterium]